MTTAASGSITPACRRRAVLAADCSRSRRANSESRWCHRRLTTPATAFAPSARSPRSRMRSAATRSPRPLGSWSIAAAAVLITLVGAVPLGAQPRTDVITLANGDRVTGDVERLDRGRVEFKTDDIGTIYLEWDKVATVVSKNQFEVIT